MILKLWDLTCLTLMIIYQILFLFIPAYIILQQRLAIAISFSILMEQTRFVMKTYSFMRTVAPRVLKRRNNKFESLTFPTLKMYLYFLFAPTLVYRDEYPRWVLDLVKLDRWLFFFLSTNIKLIERLEFVGKSFFNISSK